MRAALVEQPRAALAVTEQHQPLAERGDDARGTRRIAAERHRVPVAPQQLAHRRAAPDQRQRLVEGRRGERVGAQHFHLTLL